MRTKNLQEWLREHQAKEAAAEVEELTATEKRERGDDEGGEEGEERDKSKWDMVVQLVQTAFRDGVLAEEATWQTVVLIPKGGGDYRIIGLMEVVWKAVTVILNCCFTASVTYQHSLHRFRAGCGTGNATLQVKLLQKGMTMR